MNQKERTVIYHIDDLEALRLGLLRDGGLTEEQTAILTENLPSFRAVYTLYGHGKSIDRYELTTPDDRNAEKTDIEKPTHNEPTDPDDRKAEKTNIKKQTHQEPTEPHDRNTENIDIKKPSYSEPNDPSCYDAQKSDAGHHDCGEQTDHVGQYAEKSVSSRSLRGKIDINTLNHYQLSILGECQSHFCGLPLPDGKSFPSGAVKITEDGKVTCDVYEIFSATSLYGK